MKRFLASIGLMVGMLMPSWAAINPTNFNRGSFIVDPQAANPTNVIIVNLPFHGGAYDLPGNAIWWVSENILNSRQGYVPFLAGPTNFGNSPWNVLPDGINWTTNKIAFNDTNYFIQRIPPLVIIGTNTVDTTIQFDIPSWTGTGTRALTDDGQYHVLGGGVGIINPTDNYLPYRIDATTFGDSPWNVVTTNKLGFYGPVSFLVYSNLSVGLGMNALVDNTGAQNVAIGDQALQLNTTGNGNVAIGNGALYAADTSYNIGIGVNALNGGGSSDNIAIGHNAMVTTPTAYESVAIGVDALTTATQGYNVAVGNGSGAGVIGGTQNTFVGTAADAVTEGNYNVIIGSSVGNVGATHESARSVVIGSGNANTSTNLVNSVIVGTAGDGASPRIATSSASLTNVIAIGYDVGITNNNEIVIGNTTNTAVIFPITSYTGTGAKVLTDNGTYQTAGTLGLTINSQDGYLPVRGNATTFTNSWLYNTANGVGTDTNLYFGPGTTNVLYRSGQFLVVTNGATDGVGIQVKDGNAATATFGTTVSGGALVGAAGGKLVYLDPDNASASYRGSSTDFAPYPQGKNLGWLSADTMWHDLLLDGTGYVYGYAAGPTFTNYSRLAVFQTDTNSPVVFDIQSLGSGTNGANQGFSFRTNGVEILSLTGPGGGGILSQLLWTNSPTGAGTSASSWGTIASLPSGLNAAILNTTGDVFALGEIAGDSSAIINSTNIYNIGYATGGSGAITNTSIVFNIGDFAGGQQTVNDSFDIYNIGNSSGQLQDITTTTTVLNIGNLAGYGSAITDSFDIYNFGYDTGANGIITNSADVYAYGTQAGTALNAYNGNSIHSYGSFAAYAMNLWDSTNIFSYGNGAGRSSVLTNALDVYSYGDDSGKSMSLTNVNDIFSYGYGSSESMVATDSVDIYNYGSGAGSVLKSTNSGNLFNYGAEAGKYESVTNAGWVYNYGTRSGYQMISTENFGEIYNHGDNAGNGMFATNSTDIFNYGHDAGKSMVADGSTDVYAYGYQALYQSKLTNSSQVYAYGNSAGASLAGDGYSDIYLLAASAPTRKTNEFVFGDANYLYAFPGQTIRSGTNSTASTDAIMVLQNRLTGTTASHAFLDESAIDVPGNYAYASYDARSSIGGSEIYNHMNGFQARQIYASSGIIASTVDFLSSPQYDGPGRVNTHYGMRILDPTGTGPIHDQYGIYINNLTRGTNTNYQLWSDGTNYSWFKGPLVVQISTNSTGATDSSGHIILRGVANGTVDQAKEFNIGVNTTGNYGYLQSRDFATTFTPIALNPNGGNVGVGTNGPVEALQVQGNVKTSGKALLKGGVQDGYTNVLTSATGKDFFYVSVPNTNMIGGQVIYQVACTDGTDVQSVSGRVTFDAVAKSTTVTANTSDVQNSAICTGGSTLTAALAKNVATNNVFALGVTATTSLTTTNLVIKWRVETPSTFTIVPIP